MLGGALISLNILGSGWRPVFLINIPIGFIATFGALALVKEGRSHQAPRLDLAGAVLGTAAVVLVVFPLIQGRTASWAGWIWLLLALSVPAFGIFALQQRWLRRRGRWPVVDPELFRGGSFGTELIIQFMCFAGVSGVFLVLAIELEEGHQFSALSTGLAFLPIAAGTALASGIAIPLLPRLGKVVLQIGARRTIELGAMVRHLRLAASPARLASLNLSPAQVHVLALPLRLTLLNAPIVGLRGSAAMRRDGQG